MNFSNSLKIVKKDWKGTLRDKQILPAIIIFPIVFTIILPLIMLILVFLYTERFLSDNPGIINLIVLLNASHLSPQLQAAKAMIKWMIIPFFYIFQDLPLVLLHQIHLLEKKKEKQWRM